MSGFFAIPAVMIPPLAFPTMIIILGHLGYEFVRGIQVAKGTAKAQAQAGVFRSANGVEVELKLTEEGNLELCVDEEQLRAMEGIEKEELSGKIVQGYTHHKVIEELEAQGYTVVEEEELDTGTIRLVVRKWS
jgi:hypothetical protein